MKSITLVLCLVSFLFCRDTEAFSSADRHQKGKTRVSSSLVVSSSHSPKKKKRAKRSHERMHGRRNIFTVNVGMQFHSFFSIGHQVGWAPKTFYRYQPRPVHGWYVASAKRYDHHRHYVVRKQHYVRPVFIEREPIMPVVFINQPFYSLQHSIWLTFHFV